LAAPPSGDPQLHPRRAGGTLAPDCGTCAAEQKVRPQKAQRPTRGSVSPVAPRRMKVAVRCLRRISASRVQCCTPRSFVWKPSTPLRWGSQAFWGWHVGDQGDWGCRWPV